MSFSQNLSFKTENLVDPQSVVITSWINSSTDTQSFQIPIKQESEFIITSQIIQEVPFLMESSAENIDNKNFQSGRESSSINDKINLTNQTGESQEPELLEHKFKSPRTEQVTGICTRQSKLSLQKNLKQSAKNEDFDSAYPVQITNNIVEVQNKMKKKEDQTIANNLENPFHPDLRIVKIENQEEMSEYSAQDYQIMYDPVPFDIEPVIPLVPATMELIQPDTLLVELEKDEKVVSKSVTTKPIISSFGVLKTKLTSLQIRRRREKARLRRLEKLRNESEEDKMGRRIRVSVNRMNETEEQRVARLERERIRTAQRRLMESEEERKIRLEKNRVQVAQRRLMESEEERVKRLEKSRIRTAQRRLMEKEEERKIRLEKNRVQVAQRRLMESEEERKIRLEYARIQVAQRRRMESEEERKIRLEKDRVRLRTNRAKSIEEEEE